MSSTSSITSSPKEGWFPYAVPSVAASVAIILPFRDMIAKSAQQKELPIPRITFLVGVKEGIKAAPAVGTIVGLQVIFQDAIEKKLVGEGDRERLPVKLASSALVGVVSAPVLAIFNGNTMGWSIWKSLRKFSLKQGAAIAFQETAFVGGLCAADELAAVMKRRLGDNKVVDYTARFVSGALASLAGHPANTLLTRWQSGMEVDSLGQLMRGSARRMRAAGFFSVTYKLAKETLDS